MDYACGTIAATSAATIDNAAAAAVLALAGLASFNLSQLLNAFVPRTYVHAVTSVRSACPATCWLIGWSGVQCHAPTMPGIAGSLFELHAHDTCM